MDRTDARASRFWLFACVFWWGEAGGLDHFLLPGCGPPSPRESRVGETFVAPRSVSDSSTGRRIPARGDVQSKSNCNDILNCNDIYVMKSLLDVIMRCIFRNTKNFVIVFFQSNNSDLTEALINVKLPFVIAKVIMTRKE